MWPSIITVFIAAIFGASGWTVTRLLFEPMTAIVDLRRRAMECLIVYGDLQPNASADERQQAGETFRRVGAGLVSHHYAAYSWVKWFYVRPPIAWDIHSAGERMIRIGNGIQFSTLRWPNNLAEVSLIRRCLRFPNPELSPLDSSMMAHTGQPAPIDPHDLG